MNLFRSTTTIVTVPKNCSPLRRALLLIPLVLACFGLLPSVQATDLGSVVAGGNTADGSGVLVNLTTGTNNSGFGSFALNGDTSGSGNTAMGRSALFSNTTSSFNTATGFFALLNNTTGSQNTADGVNALHNNTTGINNTAIGVNALNFSNNSYNTAVGHSALAGSPRFGFHGRSNVGIGYRAGSSIFEGSGNVCIGAGVLGAPFDINTIRIGNPGLPSRIFIAGIRGVATFNANAIPVVIDSAGQLGTVSSSERFKKEIKPMDKASEAILALKPVTFHYKSDGTNTPQFGLIAEEVGKVDPDLVVRDENGDIYTVRYDAVNAMLLNEFLKEHRTVQNQQQEIDALKAELKDQRAFIQRVNDKVELNRPAPQTVANNQ